MTDSTVYNSGHNSTNYESVFDMYSQEELENAFNAKPTHASEISPSIQLPNSKNAKESSKVKSRIPSFIRSICNFKLSELVKSYALPARNCDRETLNKDKQNFLSEPGNRNKATNVKIPSSEGTQLDGIAIHPNINDTVNFREGEAQDQKWVVLFCPNSDGYESNLEFAKAHGNAVGANVLLFNYRGVGQSTGDAKCAKDLIQDGSSSVQFLLDKGVKPENIVLHGQSLGGGVAVRVAEEKKVNVISVRSFKSYKRAAVEVAAKYTHSRILGKVAGGLFVAYGWKLDAFKAWKKLPNENKAIMHHLEDNIINSNASLVKAVQKHDNELVEKNIVQLKASSEDAHNYSLATSLHDFKKLNDLTNNLLTPKTSSVEGHSQSPTPGGTLQ